MSEHSTDPRMSEYLADPFLAGMYDMIMRAGALKAITVDVTEVCNLRCQGCYFFVENMDDSKSPKDEEIFEAFIREEKQRGTNYITVLGGEPALVLPRVKKLHDNFRVISVTNGTRRIPMEGFETMPIAVSVWGDHATDKELRGRGKIPVFARALRNYKDDPRVTWYFTISAGNAHEVESVVEQCIANNNYIYFNYYEDNDDVGGTYSHSLGFSTVRRQVDRMIDAYPERIISTSYLNKVATTNRLFEQQWGYSVCPTVSANNPKNADRLANGIPFNPHFRAYNPDLQTVRRCCVGEARDCDKCYNAYARHTWIMINKKKHLESKSDFTNWLSSVFTFYLLIRAIDFDTGAAMLPEIHRRLSGVREYESLTGRSGGSR